MYDMKDYREVEAHLDRIKAASTHEEMLDALDGMSTGAFSLVDEQPALFDLEHREHGWSILMRQVRNDRDNDLFDRLVRKGQG